MEEHKNAVIPERVQFVTQALEDYVTSVCSSNANITITNITALQISKLV